MKKALAAMLIFLVMLGGLALGEAPAPDIDLSAVSDTVAYAQLVNMTLEPDAYVGKIVRMSGWFSMFYDDYIDVVYLTCEVPDGTGCCTMGLEFLWEGEHAYPQDYPSYGTPMTVTGRFEEYEENGVMYVHLVDTDVEWQTEES